MRPIEASDYELIAAAEEVLQRLYKPFWHMVSAAVRSRDGRIWTGIHLGATVGRMHVCAEPIAFGRALIEGDGTIATAVALRQPKDHEAATGPEIVPPCGACREMLADYAPEAEVIVPGSSGPQKLGIRALLPLPYRR